MAKKQIANVDEGSFPAERPDYMNDDAVRGQENVGIEDISIPRLDIVQSLSPQRRKNDPAYIEGAEEGLLFNSVTNTLYGDKVHFVPVYFRKEWLIWKNQDAGGGFNGAYPSEATAKDEMVSQGFEGQTFTKDGNEFPTYEIIDTAQHFGLIVHDNGSTEEVVISMSKSKMKISRQLNTMVKMSGGDRFSRVYEIGAAVATNAANQEYYNFTLKQLGFVPEEIYHNAEKVYDAISTGAKDVNRDPVVKGDDSNGSEY